MIVKDCLSKNYPSLLATASPVEAFDFMKSNQLTEIPIIDTNDSTFLGMISEKDTLSDLGIKEISELISPISKGFVHEEDSALEALRYFTNNPFDTMAVLDIDRKLIGVVKKARLVEHIAKSFHYDLPGSVILILAEQREFAMHHLIRVVEQEGVKVLACSTSEVEHEESMIRVTLKLNQFDSGKVVSALRRYEYVVESISDRLFEQEFIDKADEFLHYLSI